MLPAIGWRESDHVDHNEQAASGPDAGPLGEARDLWRVLHELIADVLLQVRPDGTIIFLNRSPSDFSAAPLLGSNVLDLVAPAMRDDVRQSLAEIRAGDPTRRGVIQAELSDGTRRWYATTAAPVSRDGRVVAISVAARDLALKKTAGAPGEEHPVDGPLFAQQDRQVQRLETIGMFAGGLVHNFNNILTVIGSAASMLLDAMPESDPMRLDVESIQRALTHGATLTRQLLLLARHEVAQRTRVELNTVVQEVAGLSRLLLGRDVRLEVHLEPEGAPVHVDRGEMEQVLLNLLLNARDAMPRGGSIVVSTSRLAYSATSAPHGCKLRGAVVRLRVEDNGTGIDDATRERIFEPFFTTKGPERGTGLGLPTVEAIVKASGGCLDLASRLGAGTVVDVVLQDADRVGRRAA